MLGHVGHRRGMESYLSVCIYKASWHVSYACSRTKLAVEQTVRHVATPRLAELGPAGPFIASFRLCLQTHRRWTILEASVPRCRSRPL